MKKQNDSTKSNHYRAYKTNKSAMKRHQEVLDSIPEHCWWLRTYLRGIYFTKGR